MISIFSEYYKNKEQVEAAIRGSEVAEVLMMYKKYKGEDLSRLTEADFRTIAAYSEDVGDVEAYLFGFDFTMDYIVYRSKCISCKHCPYSNGCNFWV